MGMMRTIVVATDGSSIAAHAVRTALDLAAALPDRPAVHVVSVVDYADVPAALAKAPPGAPDLLAEEARRALDAAREAAAERGVAIETQTLRGHVVSSVLAFARSVEASLIVVGTHGRKGVERAILGSACEGIVRSSEIPVLSVR